MRNKICTARQLADKKVLEETLTDVVLRRILNDSPREHIAILVSSFRREHPRVVALDANDYGDLRRFLFIRYADCWILLVISLSPQRGRLEPTLESSTLRIQDLLKLPLTQVITIVDD